MTKIVVLGVNGFIGSALYARLVAKGIDANGVACSSSGPRLDQDASWLRAVLDGAEVVYLCAGRTGGVGRMANDPLSFVLPNVRIHMNVFEACMWIGAFREAWVYRGGATQLVYRKDVKLFHCETSRANDASIRAALLDRYGPGRALAVGTAKRPGPLHGIRGDEWAALAVALVAEGKPHAPLFDRFESATLTQEAQF